MTETDKTNPVIREPVTAQPVATGQRLDETHYEAEPDQVARVRFTEKPPGPLPADIEPRADAAPVDDAPPVEDVAKLPPGPSVWDARPTED